MDQKLIYHHSYKQTLHMSTSMKHQVEILNMDRTSLVDKLSELAQANPFLEYTPSQETQQYLNEGFAAKPSLQDELYYQLHTCNQPYDEHIAEYIIESLDEHGFFTIDITQACYTLHVEKEEFLITLSLIQEFEPFGVGAKNSIESIIIQLQIKQEYTAAMILKNHQKEIQANDFHLIAKQMHLTYEKVIEALQMIRHCTPFPCANYSTQKIDYVLPEFEIIVEDDDLRIEPKDIGTLCLQTNGLEKEKDPIIKEYMRSAKFYIDCINKRNKTILLLANELIQIQKGYFLYQDELRPCTLKQIASATGFAISTVSRTLSGKYYTFNQQIYPIKDLFVSKTKQGASKDAIIKAIQYYIQHEKKDHPYLDEELVDLLKQMELFVSRRTIAKYRNEIHIQNSKNRKKAYARKENSSF